VLSALQEKAAFLPGYTLKKPAEAKSEGTPQGDPGRDGKAKTEGGGRLGTASPVSSAPRSPSAGSPGRFSPEAALPRGLIPDGIVRGVDTGFRRLDRLARGDGSPPLDARAKVLVTIVFILSVVSFDRYALPPGSFFLYRR